MPDTTDTPDATHARSAGTRVDDLVGAVSKAVDLRDRTVAVAAARELAVLAEPHTPERAHALTYLAIAAGECRDDTLALELALEAKALIELLPFDRQIDLYNLLTLAYGNIGDRARCLENSLAALDATMADGDRRRTFLALNNLGYFFLLEGEPERARGYYERAQPLAGDDPKLLGLLHRNTSQVYIGLGELDVAHEHATLALEIAESADDELVVRYAQWAIAQIARRRGDRQTAISTYRQVLDSGFDHSELRSFCSAELAECHRANGDLDEAIASLERSRVELECTPNRVSTIECYEDLSLTYKLAGRFDDALRCLERAHRLHREVYDDHNEAQIRALDVEHRLQALRSESELLQQKNEELAMLNEMISELSMRDDLTGLYNRRHLFERAAEMLTAAVADHRPLAVAMIDIDHFKAVNDSHGHGVGDAVIRVVGEALAASIGDADVLARYGGEEFVVVMPETPLDRAVESCERLRGLIAGMSWPQPDLRIHVSIGVAQLSAGDTWDELLARADRHLYAAKDSGRNRVRAASSASPEPVAVTAAS